MKQITDTKELRTIQMEILDIIVDVCERHNIEYSLAGGTLIGALRHKGYIPWDDDIDLFMMRHDYDRFLAIFNKEQEEKQSPYELLSPEITKDYVYTFGKVADKRTIMIEDELQDFTIGVYVDIFPIDYVNEEMLARKVQYKLMHILYKIRRCKMIPSCCLKSRLAYYCYRYLPLPLKVINWSQRKYVFRRNPTSLICNIHGDYANPSYAFPVEAMQSFTEAEFEGKQYKIMAGYEEYLKRMYKFHYMTLPPEDQRYHHSFKAWWKE
ncbi:MAG: LicD family protein [Bacteroidaceae bacterium]|nr:LicD family protein [Bacteroidaceae bacterium]